MHICIVFLFKLHFLHWGGNCDHLDPHPSYADFNHSTTASWNKPWPPEIDWLDPYVDLSAYSQKEWKGLAVGVRMVKTPKFSYRSEYGCRLNFNWDIELSQKYYLENYANKTNETMFVCGPHVVLDESKREQYGKIYWNISCWTYRGIGILEVFYQRGTWSYLWDTSGDDLLAKMIVAGLINIIGFFGELLY